MAATLILYLVEPSGNFITVNNAGILAGQADEIIFSDLNMVTIRYNLSNTASWVTYCNCKYKVEPIV